VGESNGHKGARRPQTLKTCPHCREQFGARGNSARIYRRLAASLGKPAAAGYSINKRSETEVSDAERRVSERKWWRPDRLELPLLVRSQRAFLNSLIIKRIFL
jgi:hypothetical protein